MSNAEGTAPQSDGTGGPGHDLPSISAAMFNPAMIAVILAAAAYQYEDTSSFPMPWPLSYLVPPMVLHDPTRQVIPRTSRTSLPKWASDQVVLTAGLPARVQHLAPYVRQGLRFALREQLLELTLQGTALQCSAPPKSARKVPGDLPSIVRGAGMLGRIFGRTGDATSVFVALRVRP